MALSVITPVSPQNASHLIDNYRSAILKKVANNDESITDFFQWSDSGVPNPPTQTLFGFTMPMGDYIKLVNLPGVTHYKVHFGLEDTQPENAPLFVLIIQGMNCTGGIRSAYFKLAKPVNQKPRRLSSTNELSGQVPDILFDNWTESWADLFEGTSPVVSPKICQIMVDKTISSLPYVLLSYEFKHQDFTNVLLPETVKHYTDVVFYLVNHKYQVLDNDGNHVDRDSIGVMVASCNKVQDDGHLIYSPESAFYDFSRPCPPTC